MPSHAKAASLTEFFTADHRRCDALWTEVESAAGGGDAEDTVAAWTRFDEAMRAHLDMEEQVLFPAFDERSGMSGAGPTMVMRAEHDQMREVLRVMGNAALAGDYEELLDQGDTLLMLIGQHNVKEENMLYPMAADMLDWPPLRDRLPR